MDIESLQAYDWPGNVRELQNVIERALIGAQGSRLALALPSDANLGEPTPTAGVPSLLSDKELRQLERQNLIAVLNHTRWKIAGKDGAAEFLGIHAATLTSRLKSLAIERPRRSEG